MSTSEEVPEVDEQEDAIDETTDVDPNFERLHPALRDAILKRGYDSLTAVQTAVLDAAQESIDLRVSSQTGSGKTLAIAIVLSSLVETDGEVPNRTAHPRAIVLTPTRELAAQVKEELSWALAGLGAKVAVVAGGASYQSEARALLARPRVIVATPGRLIDHLERGAIATANIAAVVLDEADQMLDLGFRESLEAILSKMPEERRTHLVSATFSPDVLGLAKRFQKSPRFIEGTRHGAANADIEHVLHLVADSQRIGAVINVLLAHPEEQTLVFARTRMEVAHLTEELVASGLPAASLSGELAQEARNRALAAFRNGNLRVLVATDVAARGIDVQDIARVIHLTPPGDPESYVHRSGRTGRAGRKGVSVSILPPGMYWRAMQMFDRINVTATVEPVPTAREIHRAADERLFEELTKAEGVIDPRFDALARRLLERDDALSVVGRLLGRTNHAGSTEPRVVFNVKPPPPRAPRGPKGHDHRLAPHDRPAILDRPLRGGARYTDRPPAFEERPPRAPRGPARPDPFADRANAPAADAPPPRERVRNLPPRNDSPRDAEGNSHDWVPFAINWGERKGADPRRLLALVCRRGNIRGNQVGSIRIGQYEATFEVQSDVAMDFAASASRPDERDPGLKIKPRVHPPGAPPPSSEPRAARSPRAQAERESAPKRDGDAVPRRKFGSPKPPAGAGHKPPNFPRKKK